VIQLSEYVKGKCIICHKIVDVSSLNEFGMMTQVIIPVICSDCTGIAEDYSHMFAKRVPSRRRKTNSEKN